MATRGRKPGSLVRARCCVCGTVELATGASQHSRCQRCQNSGLRSHKGRPDWLGKEVAGALVAAEIRAGRLPHPRNLRCADCSGPACEYEHRDYNQPLRVDPICRGCNLRRGPARPRVGGIRYVVGRGFVPYSLRSNAVRVLALIGVDTDCLRDAPSKLTVDHWRALLPLIEQAEAPAPKPAEQGA